ncbi:MAG: hypothetical protein WD716_10760 [Fimbriimonadaceae bacterium]
MLKAWYTYADRVGYYEAGKKDAPRVALLVAVIYALLAFAMAWPFLMAREGAGPMWPVITFAALVVAVVLLIRVQRFHPPGHKDSTHSRTIASLVVIAWLVVSLILELPVVAMFLPFWGMFVLDALANITKVLRSAQRPDANLPNPRTTELPN